MEKPKTPFFDLKLITLNILSFLLTTSSSLLAPYYPIVAKNYSLENSLIGLVLASHAIGSFCFSILLIKTIAKWGRRNLMVIGVFLHFSGNIIFASLSYFQEFNSFISVSIVSRFIQGLGFAAFTTASLAMIPIIYQNEEEKIEGYLEVSSSLGTMIGPLVGSFLYTLGGYQTPFYCLAGTEFFFFLVLIKIFANDRSIVKLKDKSSNIVSIRKVFLSREGIFGFLAVTCAVCSYNFMDPSLSYRLDNYHISQSLFGVFFTLSTFTYLVSMILTGRFSSQIDKRVWMSFGIFITGLSYYFLLHQEIWGLISGLVLMGLGTSLILIPSLQQYRIMAFKIYRENNSKDDVNDMTSGMFTSANAVGEFLGPIIGGIFVDQLGFIEAVKWYGIGLFGFFLAYLFLGDSLIGFLSVTLDLNLGKTQDEIQKEEIFGKKINFSASRFIVFQKGD